MEVRLIRADSNRDIVSFCWERAIGNYVSVIDHYSGCYRKSRPFAKNVYQFYMVLLGILMGAYE